MRTATAADLRRTLSPLGVTSSTFLDPEKRKGRINLAGQAGEMTTPACPSYAGHRFPVEIISRAVWLYFRFPLSLRMVDASCWPGAASPSAVRPCASGR